MRSRGGGERSGGEGMAVPGSKGSGILQGGIEGGKPDSKSGGNRKK